jgi:hypothetical protein
MCALNRVSRRVAVPLGGLVDDHELEADAIDQQAFAPQ